MNCMTKRELNANDPMEVRLMGFAETVNKAGSVIMIAVLLAAVILGISVSAGDLAILAGIVVPSAILIAVIWVLRELICLWLENQTEMHCYARTQTEILLEMAEKEKEK